MQSIVLPGDELERERLPKSSHASRGLRLGPGLHVVDSLVISNAAGALRTDSKKNAAWVENNARKVRSRLIMLARLADSFSTSPKQMT